MNRIERAAERNPGLYPFGTEPLKRLTAEEEKAAPFEARLRSSWCYITGRAQRFTATLSAREQAHLSAEDLVNEIALSLLERDGKWSPERGRYVTFCEQVIQNVISMRREQARVVTAPSNAAGRLKAYRERAAAGKLSRASAMTMRSIEAALGDVEGVPREADAWSGPDRRDDGPASPPDVAGLVEAIRGLDSPAQALVLGRTYGLFGNDEQSARQIAEGLGVDPKEVRNLQGRAGTALRRRIEKLKGNQP